MKFRISVFRDQHGCYKAVCPALPGCDVHGETREATAGRIEETIRGYIAALSDFVLDRVEHECLEVGR